MKNSETNHDTGNKMSLTYSEIDEIYELARQDVCWLIQYAASMDKDASKDFLENLSRKVEDELDGIDLEKVDTSV